MFKILKKKSLPNQMSTILCYTLLTLIFELKDFFFFHYFGHILLINNMD